MTPSRTACRSPHFASLAEAARVAKRTVEDLRLELSKLRRRRYAARLADRLTLGEAAFLLAVSSSVVKALIRSGRFEDNPELVGSCMRHGLSKDEVLAWARERGKTAKEDRNA